MDIQVPIPNLLIDDRQKVSNNFFFFFKKISKQWGMCALHYCI